MHRRCCTALFALALIALALSVFAPISCSTAGSTADAAAGGDRPPTSWKQVMQAIGSASEDIDQQLRAPGHGDLKQVAATARKAASAMALGYGALEQPGIQGFAGHARDTESWLLQLAIESSQAHGDLAAELWARAETHYCHDCHDAADKVGKAGKAGKHR